MYNNYMSVEKLTFDKFASTTVLREKYYIKIDP